MPFAFCLHTTDARTCARTGTIHTTHGDVPTPAFAPVGTQATVKAVSPRDLEELGTPLILANTYHLYLRPGIDVISRLGGLHRFMGWPHPILTDSGGFQVFSLERLRSVADEGVVFRSHIDGSTHSFTPESVMTAQEALGADMIMCLDECAPPMDYERSREAVERTHRWAERCLRAQTRAGQALFGIVQGGAFPDLRRASARTIAGMGFPGVAVGGLSVGEPKVEMLRMLEEIEPLLPYDRPRYLMGVGSPEDLIEGVARGMDLFDCVLPARIARNGALFTGAGRLNIRNAQYATDAAPIEDGCSCYTCQKFSRSYLRHLVMCGEVLALQLATVHNLRFVLELMRKIRASIAEGSFSSFREGFLATYRVADSGAREQNRAAHRARNTDPPARASHSDL